MTDERIIFEIPSVLAVDESDLMSIKLVWRHDGKIITETYDYETKIYTQVEDSIGEVDNEK